MKIYVKRRPFTSQRLWDRREKRPLKGCLPDICVSDKYSSTIERVMMMMVMRREGKHKVRVVELKLKVGL